MGVNTKYKASVFSLLFSAPDTLRDLYCALAGVTLPCDIPVTVNTLQNVLFMGRVNDISFEIGGKLVVLIEHQSTINPNMALRLLIYIARIYETIIQEKKIYSKQRIVIPRPEFYVLYNGTDSYPDEETIRLSDLFESITSLGLPEKGMPSLELEVKVLNINEGKNAAIGNRCKILAEYSAFIAKVREHEKEDLSREEAIKKAVKYCSDHDILKEFLGKNVSEVMNMLITEWNWDDALDVRYEEGREEGREEERKFFIRNALTQGLPIDTIQTLTGLDLDTIKNIQVSKEK